MNFIKKHSYSLLHPGGSQYYPCNAGRMSGRSCNLLIYILKEYINIRRVKPSQPSPASPAQPSEPAQPSQPAQRSVPFGTWSAKPSAPRPKLLCLSTPQGGVFVGKIFGSAAVLPRVGANQNSDPISEPPPPGPRGPKFRGIYCVLYALRSAGSKVGGREG